LSTGCLWQPRTSQLSIDPASVLSPAAERDVIDFANGGCNDFEAAMRTKEEIEAAICDAIGRFEHEYMGRGPKYIHAYLIDNIIFVRLQGVLTAAEQHLVKSQPPEKGRDLLKEVRKHLLETARPLLEAMVKEIAGIKVVSMHHDISTATGEEAVLVTLAEAPQVREAKSRSRAF
jgi:uncharacterized protein YbcI